MTTKDEHSHEVAQVLRCLGRSRHPRTTEELAAELGWEPARVERLLESMGWPVTAEGRWAPADARD